MNALHKGANDRRDGLTIGLEHAKTDGRAHRIFMPRRVAAAVEIEAHSGCFFLKRKAGFGLAEHDERNGALDARAAAAFESGKRMKMIWGSG